jgi:xylan 1,4-beta-xylosidase
LIRSTRWLVPAVLAGVLAASISTASGQSVPLTATVHFDRANRPGEQINLQLLGTVNGVNGPPPPGVNRLLRTQIGPPFIRVDIGFEGSGCPTNPNAGPLYNQADNTFNYCQVDQRIAQVVAAHAHPLLIIDYTPPALGTPDCVATNGAGYGASRCPPSDLTKYGALVEAAMIHAYRKFGASDFEVWNEPDLPLFFAGVVNDYLALYETCNAALLAAEQQLGVSPGTLHLGGPTTFIADQNFIQSLMADAANTPELRVDFISWHYYANYFVFGAPNPALDAGIFGTLTREVQGYIAPYLAQRPDLAPKLWIDEWNVDAVYDPRMDTTYDAAFELAALHSMQDAGLDRAARFNTADCCSNSATTGNFGIFTFDDKARPALYGLEMWRDLAAQRVAVEPTDATDLSHYTQNLIASIGGHTATILVYNFVPYSPADASPPYCGGGGSDLAATLTLQGLKNGRHKVGTQRFDCSMGIVSLKSATLPTASSKLTVANGQATLSVTVPPDGAVLITVHN